MRRDTTRARGEEAALRKFALGFPEAYEDFPWGERAFKVRKKVFLFMGGSKERLGLSVKLPKSGAAALMAPFAEPTHYGLGKSGWVTARFEQNDPLPMDLLFDWIEESYRSIAPKKLVAEMPESMRSHRTAAHAKGVKSSASARSKTVVKGAATSAGGRSKKGVKGSATSAGGRSK